MVGKHKVPMKELVSPLEELASAANLAV